ncbi:hypothetical protein OA2633_04536 [Oceanicaulis sp. HTCC2633]|uniref:hypothetical protein n=1 Tax=Oceanicaulis sp. HTCC2633 TaxID=314254 RepID=UPI000066D6CD|nr:hypothetical protein [Oceanicaulis sp. HTCC2633]EAP91415.1 hypothetical protein OA2633_04536 [Oceanicaulis sp. HTCC2633]
MDIVMLYLKVIDLLSVRSDDWPNTAIVDGAFSTNLARMTALYDDLDVISSEECLRFIQEIKNGLYLFSLHWSDDFQNFNVDDDVM